MEKMFKSLKRLTYQVPDVQKAKQWYSQILNIQPIFDTPFAAIFQIGNNSLSLIPMSNPQEKEYCRIGAYWEVDNADEAYERLIAAGAIPYSELKDVFNIRTGQVIDPFGNIIGITASINNSAKHSVENKPSETALSAVFCRAIAVYQEQQELKCPDYLAKEFLPDDRKKFLFDKEARESVIKKVVTERLYGYMLARTFFIDKVFKQALDEEIPQIILLGAGYDSRSYRFSTNIKNSRIYELDIHTTQQRKIEMLKKANIAVPEQLSFVSINFKTDKLEDVLVKAGFDKGKKSLFIWEGVMYYLDDTAVNSTLEFVRTHSPAGSILCFDYMTMQLESVNPSEPFLFWISSDKLESFLSDRGFKLLVHELPEIIQKKYLSLNDGTVVLPTLPFFSYAITEVI
jgi:methyltransferase (TIGR00027 family)